MLFEFDLMIYTFSVRYIFNQAEVNQTLVFINTEKMGFDSILG